MTDHQLLGEIQRRVIEPDDNGLTWPTGLWTRDEVVNYLNERQNRFLEETKLLASETKIAAIPHQSEQALPDDCVTVLRAAWRRSDGRITPLHLGDLWGTDHGLSRWPTTPGLPLVAMETEGANGVLLIAPPPLDVGEIEILYTGLAAVLGDISTAELITVPDIFVPALMYGVLADMLSKVGRGQDPSRAEYCESRYQEGIEAAKLLVDGGIN